MKNRILLLIVVGLSIVPAVFAAGEPSAEKKLGEQTLLATEDGASLCDGNPGLNKSLPFQGSSSGLPVGNAHSAH